MSVRCAFVNFPIETLYPAAYKEHVAEGCAADEGHFCFQGRDWGRVGDGGGVERRFRPRKARGYAL